jgi:hypothetical protein
MVCPDVKLRFDALGRGWPSGQTVRNPMAFGSVTVTLSTTAVTPLAGTPLAPATWSWMDDEGPTAAAAVPVPVRVSNTRVGPAGVYRLPATVL